MAEPNVNVDSMYWFLHGKNFKEAYDKLQMSDKMDLAALLMNERYNNFIARYCDYGKDELPIDPEMANGKDAGKRLPYMGWYWRNVNFADKKIPIGFHDQTIFVGVMSNNKWGYPERYMTEKEADHFIAMIDEAMRISEEGGDVQEIHKRKMAALEAIFPWMQSLPRVLPPQGESK